MNHTRFPDFKPFLRLTNSRDSQSPRTDTKAFLGDLGAGRIRQLMYLPPLPPNLPNGSVLYLNRISHTKVKAFKAVGAECFGVLTGHGMINFDARLQDHLFRPKADRLPLTGWPAS